METGLRRALRTVVGPLLLVLVMTSPGGAKGPEPSDETVVTIGAGTSLRVPKGMTLEPRAFGARGDALTLIDGNEIMVITVYRRDGRERPPDPETALRAHAAELEEALRPASRRPVELTILGRERLAVEFDKPASDAGRRAWVVAFELRRRTVVASAMVVRGSPNESLMGRILDGLTVR